MNSDVIQSKTVVILLATYNGEKYLREQLDSILNQTYKNFKILVSDDGSTDNTKDILIQYEKEYPQKIQLLLDHVPFHNARDNFFYLLNQSSSDFDYYMFSDQDDVWHDDKIEKSVKAMIELESQNGVSMPLAAFSDLHPVDSELNQISKTMIAKNIDASDYTFYKMAFKNIISGCTLIINSSLRLKSLEFTNSSYIYMHDYWIGLVAYALGKVSFIDETLIDYRQHGNNVCGYCDTSKLSYFISKVFNLREIRKMKLMFKRTMKEFQDVFGNELSKEQDKFISSYIKSHSGIVFYLKNIKNIPSIALFFSNCVFG